MQTISGSLQRSLSGVQEAVAEAQAQATQNAKEDAEAAAAAGATAKKVTNASDDDSDDDVDISESEGEDDDDDDDDDDVSDSEEEGGNMEAPVTTSEKPQEEEQGKEDSAARADEGLTLEGDESEPPKRDVATKPMSIASTVANGFRNPLQRLKDYITAKGMHDEAQFKDPEALMQKFEGKEAALFRRLRNKYGCGPGIMDLQVPSIPTIQLVENEGAGGLEEYLAIHPDSARRVYDDILVMHTNGAVGEESGEPIDKEEISRCLIVADSARKLGGLRASDILAGIPLDEKAADRDRTECWLQGVPFRESSERAKKHSFKKRTEAVRRSHEAGRAGFAEWKVWHQVIQACEEERDSWQEVIRLRCDESSAWKSVAKHAKMRADALAEEIQSAKALCRQQAATAGGKGFPETGFDKDVALGKVLDSKRRQQKQWKQLKAEAEVAAQEAKDSEYDAWAQVAASENMCKDAKLKFQQDEAEKATYDDLVKKRVDLDHDQPALWERKFFEQPVEYREEASSVFDFLPGGSKW